jgi:hypothetical protein
LSTDFEEDKNKSQYIQEFGGWSALGCVGSSSKMRYSTSRSTVSA